MIFKIPMTTRIIFILYIALTACTSSQQKKELKLAHGLDTTHPVHMGMVFMADRLEEKSGGKLTIQIYPSQQLGSERQCVELLQIGSLAMTKVSSAVMEGFAPKYKVLSLPYIFKNKEHSYRVLDVKLETNCLPPAPNTGSEDSHFMMPAAGVFTPRTGPS